MAFSIAGEKMPWLTFHIALPMILLTAWGIGYLAETTDWQAFKQYNGWWALALTPILITSLSAVLGVLLSPTDRKSVV